LDHARQSGHDELTLWVVDLNVDAHRFYTSHGFMEDGATQLDTGSREMSVTARRYRIPINS
jgi:hypothetical protein